MVINELRYLVDPNNQLVLPNGSTNVAGIVRVYNAGTDDIAKTYSDFNGTRNPANIRLDNNGRAVIIADVTKAYRVDVLDSNGGLLWTVEPAYCIGGGSGGEQLTAALPIRIVDGVITNNGTGLNVFGENSWSEGIGIDEYPVAEAVGNVFLDSIIELDYTGSLRAGDLVLIGDSIQAISDVRYSSNTIVVAPGVHVSGGEKVTICGGSLGEASHTEGRATEATGKYSHAEGYRSKAFGYYSHAEGKDTRAYSDGAHAEGEAVVAQGTYSHAEGLGSTDYLEVTQDCTESALVEITYVGPDVVVGSRVNIGNDIYSIVAIDEDTPSVTLSAPVTLRAGDRMYVMTGAFGSRSHAEGDATVSAGTGSHSEGSNTAALEVGAHSEGRETVASNYSTHAEGYKCVASGINAHAEGDESVASEYCSHAEGSSESSGYYSHSEGDATVSAGTGSHSEGSNTAALEVGAHSEGQYSVSLYYGSHAEGFGTFAKGYGAHSEGYGEVEDTYNVVDDDGGYERSSVRLYGTNGIHVGDLICFDYQWPAPANDWFLVTYVDTDTNTVDIDGYTSALNGASVYIARGVATGDGAHAEGKYCVAAGHGTHAGGEHSSAYGLSAFSQGEGNTVAGDYSTAIGKYNNVDSDESVAIGSSCSNRADHSVTIGTYASSSSSAVNSTTVGYQSSSNAAYATTLGFGAKANEYASTAIGSYAEAYGTQSLAINRGKSFGAYSVCIGDSGNYSFSTYTTADVVESDTIPVDDISGIFVGDLVQLYDVGTYTVVNVGVDSITISANVSAYEYTDIYVWRKGALGNHSLHIGSENAAKGDYSVCIGEGLTMAANYGVAFGKYNSDPQAMLVVGDGVDENTLSDCFKIDGQGKLWFMHNGNLTDLSTLLNTHNIT